MRKLSENERRILERLRNETDYLSVRMLPNGKRSDARARTVLSLCHLGLIETKRELATGPDGRSNLFEYYNRFAERADVRLTERGRAALAPPPAREEGVT